MVFLWLVLSVPGTWFMVLVTWCMGLRFSVLVWGLVISVLVTRCFVLGFYGAWFNSVLHTWFFDVWCFQCLVHGVCLLVFSVLVVSTLTFKVLRNSIISLLMSSYFPVLSLPFVSSNGIRSHVKRG